MPRKLPALAVAVLSLTVTAEASAAGYATRTLRVGSSGSDVRAFQRYLDRAGFDTTADGAFGPNTRRSVIAFERAEDRRVNGVASRSDQRLARAKASAADGGEGEPVEQAPEKGYIDSDGMAVAPSSAPDEVKAVIDAGNRIATKPYRYGGGHARWNDTGYDCSGSLSYVLHAAGLLSRARDSTGFMSYGEAGRGTWITIRTNPGHAYLIVAGLRFDTSAHKATGSRWSEQMRSASGFRGRHPEGF
ncbi:MAG TPA: peptidoglycan-binding domain-containing protein [Thermoleophilaceae bacterium]|nr:peptidoglycan-binding domain-containing protein [Thermoleophilaceae bacterium]